MLPTVTPLFNTQPARTTETIDTLLQTKQATLEHIISRGEASAPDFWYQQETHEWVALIAGNAKLEFEKGSLQLQAGDALTIPAQLKHRVASTSQDAVWIALHYT